MSKRRVILFFCNDFPYFMAHRAHVALRAAREGWDVHVAVGGDVSAFDAATQAFTLHHVMVDRLGFAPIADMRMVLTLRRLVRSLRPDAIQLITMKPIVFGALAASLFRFPTPRIVATFPGLGRIFDKGGRLASLRQGMVMKLLRHFFSRPGRAATFENRKDRDFLVGKEVIAADAALVVAGAGLDLAAFDRPRRPREPSKSPVFLWASRLIRGKGLHAFAEAAALARKAGSRSEFLVAGYADPGHPDNIAQDELESLWRNAPVTYLGHVTDMPALFARSDVLVLPTSYQEGLPRILIEAAAAGVPSVASNIAGCLEIVEDGRTGLVLEDTSGEAIWRSLSRLEKDLALLARLGTNARKKVTEGGYDQTAVQDVFLRLYGGNR